MRQALSFVCAGAELAGMLDVAPRDTGLLIVSGGNEIAAGAHAGMARLAAGVAAQGFPVLRFDRRGVGDSEGENGGYATSADDIAAASTAFRNAMPTLRYIVAFGNCDAATALGLFHHRISAAALILANPWLFDTEQGLPPTAAIKARYSRKLRDPREWLRLLRGDVDLARLFKGLGAMSIAPKPSDMATRLRDGLAASALPVRLILASNDATALAFAERWQSPAFAALRTSARFIVEEIDTASHSFAAPGDAEALLAGVIAALEAASGGF